MKVLLTGSNGLVGSNIQEHKPKYINLLTPLIGELDLLNSNEVDKYLKVETPDLIIHAAGIVGGIQANIDNPVKFLTENTQIGHNLILAAKNNKVKYFINLGSSCMYPREAKNPLKENLILKAELEPTNEGYALAKIYSQRLCSYINIEAENINYKTLIPCNIYGRWDKFDPVWGHMIPAAIQKIHEAKINNLPSVIIWGDGNARREFMYAGDLADFIWFATQNIDRIPELINIGLGFDYSIFEYYKVISDVIGFKGTFEFDLTKPTGMQQKLVDNTKLLKLGWTPKYNLRTGIEETYDFFTKKLKNGY